MGKVNLRIGDKHVLVYYTDQGVEDIVCAVRLTEDEHRKIVEIIRSLI
jgi:hypothetical protein